MDRTQKETLVASLKEEWKGIQSIVLVDYRGIDVPTITTLRQELAKEGLQYRVVKNTLIRIAVQGSAAEPLTKLLEGPTAILWSTDSPSAAAKAATRIAKAQEKFVIKGGYFDGQLLDVAGVQSLAQMPGKDELRASLLMTLLAAPTDFVRTLAAGPTNFLYALQARERALGGNS